MVQREMPWRADYIKDTGLAAVLRSGLNGAQETPPSSLPGFYDQRPVSPAIAPIHVLVQRTPLRETEQAARTIERAAALRSEHDGAQDSPPTSLPLIRDECPASPAIAPIDGQVHTTSVRGKEQQLAELNRRPPRSQPRQNQQPP